MPSRDRSSFEQSSVWYKQLPNQLTLVRVGAVPILLVLFPLDSHALKLCCALIFAIAAATDGLDGYFARKYRIVSPVGELLDPIADKMLIAAALVLIADSQALPAWVAGAMLCRDIAISGLRLVALEQGMHINVSGYGKIKTIAQDVGIFCLMVNAPLLGLPFRGVGMLAMAVALGFSFYSAYLYGLEFWEKTKLRSP